MTSLASADRSERSYFSSHTRGDSVASIDSTHSTTTRYVSKSSTPFAHSSQSSIAAPSTSPFTKKPSFASIRNAFKSGKNNDVPPVPQLDHQAYPVLKNPFNRSTSSLTHVSPINSRAPISAPIITIPPFQRPQTAGSGEPRSTRMTPATKSKSQSYTKPHHSQSGSIFHTSDGGSDYGHGYPYSPSPPPVPRVPNAFGHVQRSETPPVSDFEEDRVVIDPKTPSDYALHAVFMRFATSAEGKIDTFLLQALVCRSYSQLDWIFIHCMCRTTTLCCQTLSAQVKIRSSTIPCNRLARLPKNTPSPLLTPSCVGGEARTRTLGQISSESTWLNLPARPV